MATKNPSINKTEETPAPVKKSSEKIAAKIKTVYVEVGANLGTKSFKFGTTADLNDEDEAVVKNRLYFANLGILESHIKELASQDGPFRR